MLDDAGIEPVTTPYQAPNANPYANAEGHLRRVVDDYIAHYHAELNHQGLGNRLIEQGDLAADGEIFCRERLGGLLKFYSRAA